MSMHMDRAFCNPPFGGCLSQSALIQYLHTPVGRVMHHVRLPLW